MIKKKIVDVIAPSGSNLSSFVEHAYTYDSLDRLVAEKRGSGGTTSSLSFSYDLAGNRLSKTSDGLRTTYTLGTGNRLASSTTSACTNSMFVSGASSETIGTDNQWGTLYISNLTANTAVIPDVNGSSFVCCYSKDCKLDANPYIASIISLCKKRAGDGKLTDFPRAPFPE